MSRSKNPGCPDRGPDPFVVAFFYVLFHSTLATCVGGSDGVPLFFVPSERVYAANRTDRTIVRRGFLI